MTKEVGFSEGFQYAVRESKIKKDFDELDQSSPPTQPYPLSSCEEVSLAWQAVSHMMWELELAGDFL